MALENNGDTTDEKKQISEEMSEAELNNVAGGASANTQESPLNDSFNAIDAGLGFKGRV